MFITSNEFNQFMAALAPFESPPVIAVATSGGPDSLALALLSHEWATKQGGKAIAVTIDHQLREGSTAEAYQVKAWLNAREMEHHTLTWIRTEENKAPQTAIQAAAREARYHLLGQWCKNQGVKHLLTAHHAQDQLETFMIRFAKGSGLRGLTSIQEVVTTDFGRIVRPLLTVDPNRLKATLEEANQPFLLDPSNRNENFTRIRWRQLLPSLAQEGITTHTLQETLDRLNHAQRLIDQHIAGLLRQHAMLSPYGYAMLKQEALEGSPEAFEEMLKRLLATIGTRLYPARRQALHQAMDRMASGHSFTLGGCQILCKPEGWWIVRELAAVKEDVPVQQSGTYLWDNRFTVSVSQKAPCHIAPLGTAGIQHIQSRFKERTKTIPSVVLKTLPALWQEEALLDLPSFAFTPRHPLMTGDV
ncbi:MAG: tilS [Alphaproteobacteria bacterium]|jgi:tRNA(Ile)-lysidine synthase|nr:tilS [Alphaproteobacteria bacterium]